VDSLKHSLDNDSLYTTSFFFFRFLTTFFSYYHYLFFLFSLTLFLFSLPFFSFSSFHYLFSFFYYYCSGSIGDSAVAPPQQKSSSAEIKVLPKPGWVIKALRTGNGKDKIFINLCEHPNCPNMPVSIGYNKWPFMVVAPPRTIADTSEK
jgi:hypothetical protein